MTNEFQKHLLLSYLQDEGVNIIKTLSENVDDDCISGNYTIEQDGGYLNVNIRVVLKQIWIRNYDSSSYTNIINGSGNLYNLEGMTSLEFYNMYGGPNITVPIKYQPL